MSALNILLDSNRSEAGTRVVAETPEVVSVTALGAGVGVESGVDEVTVTVLAEMMWVKTMAVVMG